MNLVLGAQGSIPESNKEKRKIWKTNPGNPIHLWFTKLSAHWNLLGALNI